MSQFLPSNVPRAAGPDLATQIIGRDPSLPLQSDERQLLSRLLSEPSALPQTFWAAVIDKMITELPSQIPITQLQGFRREVTREVAYVEFTTDVVCDSTRDNIVSSGVFGLADATDVLIQWFIPKLAGTATSTGTLNITEDGTDIGDVWVNDMVASSSQFGGSFGQIRRSVAAGSHTYILQGRVSAGTMTADVGTGGAGAKRPGFIRVLTASTTQ